MLLALSFLTISNAILFNTKNIEKLKITANAKSCPLPLTEEEKSQASSLSNTMTEEYLHDHHFVANPKIKPTQTHPEHFYRFYTGKNYAQLHAQPPDMA